MVGSGNHSQKLYPRKCFTDPPRNGEGKFPKTLPREEIVAGFVQMLGIILKNSSQGNVLQTHPGIGKGNFPKTLPRQALVIGFSLDTAGGEKLKKKLFQGKCFVEQGIEKGNIPKTLPRPREEIVIGFPLHTACGEKLKKKHLPREM